MWPRRWGQAGGHIWYNHAPPWRQGPLTGKGVLHHSTRAEQPPSQQDWKAVVPERPQQAAERAPTARPKWGCHRPRDEDRSRRPLPKQDAPPIASRNGALHPSPLAVRRPPPGIPGIGDATPSPQAASSASLGPRARPPTRPSRGAFHAPRPPEWNVPVSLPRVWAPPSGTRSGPLGPGGGGRRVHPGCILRREVRNRYLPPRRSPRTRSPPRSRSPLRHSPPRPALPAPWPRARADPLASGRPEVRTRGAAAAAEQQPPPTGGWREGAEPRELGGRGRGQALRQHALCAPPIAARGRGLSASQAPSVPRAPPRAQGVEGQRPSSHLTL